MSDWQAGSLESLCGALAGLTAVFVTLRFVARRKMKAGLMADDWLMIAAFIAFIGCCICTFIDNKALGTSTYALTPEEDIAGNGFARRTRWLHVLFGNISTIQIAINSLSYVALGCTKASALFLYKRIFDVPGPGPRVFKAVIWSSIVLVAAWVVAFEFVAGFQCGTHFSRLWKATHGDHCLYSHPAVYGLVVSDVLLDVWVLLLPIPNVVRLHADLVRRLAIACVGLGASVARMVVFVQTSELSPVGAEHLDARRIDSRLVFYWILEMGMSIIAINMPVVWSLLLRSGSSAVARVERGFAMLRSDQRGKEMISNDSCSPP